MKPKKEESKVAKKESSEEEDATDFDKAKVEAAADKKPQSLKKPDESQPVGYNEAREEEKKRNRERLEQIKRQRELAAKEKEETTQK